MALAGRLGIGLSNTQHADQLRLRDRLATLGEMSAGLAHEIRNPLGSIKGAAQLLEGGQDLPDDAAEMLDIILKEVAHLDHTVQGFLDYAEVPTDLSRSSVRPSEFLTAAVKLLGDDVTLEVDADLPPPATPTASCRCFATSCAMREAAPDELIEVHAHDRGDYFSVDIRDRGPGIPSELGDQVYPFRDRQVGRYGFGACHLAAHREGPSWAVGASPAKEEELWRACCYPACRSALKSPPRRSACRTLKKRPLVTTDVERVLVVDDEPNLRKVLKALLTRSGFDVVTAKDGKEAVDVLRGGGIDLLMTDIGMPGMTGLRVLLVVSKRAARCTGDRDHGARYGRYGGPSDEGGRLRLRDQALRLRTVGSDRS